MVTEDARGAAEMARDWLVNHPSIRELIHRLSLSERFYLRTTSLACDKELRSLETCRVTPKSTTL
jgi:hypothetical protein